MNTLALLGVSPSPLARFMHRLGRESQPDLFLASLTAPSAYDGWFFRRNGKGLHGKNLLTRRINLGERDSITLDAPPLSPHLS